MFWIYWILLAYYTLGLSLFVYLHIKHKREQRNNTDSIRYASLLDISTYQNTKF